MDGQKISNTSITIKGLLGLIEAKDSVLTGRYSSSPESSFARDIRRIRESGVLTILKEIDDAQLSDNFRDVALVQNLAYTFTNNPTCLVFLAVQTYFNDTSFLSSNVLDFNSFDDFLKKRSKLMAAKIKKYYSCM